MCAELGAWLGIPDLELDAIGCHTRDKGGTPQGASSDRLWEGSTAPWRWCLTYKRMAKVDPYSERFWCTVLGKLLLGYWPPHLFQLLLGLPVHLPLPGVFRGALLLQKLEQPLQTVWTKQATQTLYEKSSNWYKKLLRWKAELTLCDKVRVEDKLVRHYEASGHEQLIVSVVLDIVQRVHSSKAHWRQLLQRNQSWNLQGEKILV